MRSGTPMWIVRYATLVVLLCLNACAMVGVSRIKPHDYVTERRADTLGSGRLSDGSVQSLNVVARNADTFATDLCGCTDTQTTSGRS